MSETALDAQKEFLNGLIASRQTVWVFLVNGIKLSGTIAAVDAHVISLQSQGGTLMIYKHAIATVCEPYTRLWTDKTPRPRISDSG